jgi:hypothetical protein
VLFEVEHHTSGLSVAVIPNLIDSDPDG